MTLAAGTRLGPYEILSSLGAGGMGEVYRARDSKLDRDVAIKVLPESVAKDPDALARFEREAKAVAALSHTNILAIHDFGSQDGAAYAVMELLEGMTLREKLNDGPLSQKQAVDYALQIAKGLSAAHERGVVHRDLKPENLFVARGGHIKILDFGLAKRVEATDPDTAANAPTVPALTEPGRVMGTVGYMSPEQVRGLTIDHRSDIFSFGSVLYELLSGRRAFKRDTAADTMFAILKEDPPELSASGRDISPALDHIVRHCLEKDRDSRFQSAHDIAFDLQELTSGPISKQTRLATPVPRMSRALIVTLGVGALVAVGLLLWTRPRGGAVQTAVVKRIVVLPFENLGPPEDDYFADGIADEIRSKLTLLPGFEVIARGSSTPYKKTKKTPSQIGRELDVKYILTATVRWQKESGANRVHVIPELVDLKASSAPTSRWQQPFDASLTDVLQVQSSIAAEVAQAVGVALGSSDEKRIYEKPTENLAAYDAFLKGQEAHKGGLSADPPSVRKALGFLEQAVALDPNFAQAWAEVSMTNSLLYANSAPTPQLAQRAKEAAEKTVTLSPNRPEGYKALGDYQRLVALDFTRALEQYAKALAVAPASASVLGSAAWAEMSLGRWDAAMKHRRQAERLDPRSPYEPQGLGNTLLWLRRYPEAHAAFDRGLALAPADLSLIECKAMTFLAEGNLARSRAVLNAAPKEIGATELLAYVAGSDLVWVFDEQQRGLLLRLTPGAFDDDRGAWAISLAQAHALAGDAANVRVYAEEARKAFEEQLHATPDDAQRHAYLGLALAYLDRKEDAIREGQRGVALTPVEKDAQIGAYVQHQLVRVYMLVGESEKALDQLEPLLKIPYYLSPGWLKIDPNFDPLRKTPRFQKLVASAK